MIKGKEKTGSPEEFDEFGVIKLRFLTRKKIIRRIARRERATPSRGRKLWVKALAVIR